MNKIVKKNEDKIDLTIWKDLEKKYDIRIIQPIKDFIETNSGGDPAKSMINTQNGPHEVRKILSLTRTSKYYSIAKYADQFLNDTHGKIVPVAVDSGGNYFCVNNETGKVYFWFEEDGLYYQVADDLNEFTDEMKAE